MRRTIIIALAAVAALLAAAAPASAGGTDMDTNGVWVHRPWVPWPATPVDLAAGVYCSFAVHGDPTVDEVRTKTIEEYPDGSPKRQLATGALIYQMTNTETGASTLADASGSGVIDFVPDGAQNWHVIGPVVVAIKDGASNLPRGLWTLNGVYDIYFSPTRYSTVTFRRGGMHDVCADID